MVRQTSSPEATEEASRTEREAEVEKATIEEILMAAEVVTTTRTAAQQQAG